MRASEWSLARAHSLWHPLLFVLTQRLQVRISMTKVTCPAIPLVSSIFLPVYHAASSLCGCPLRLVPGKIDSFVCPWAFAAKYVLVARQCAVPPSTYFSLLPQGTLRNIFSPGHQSTRLPPCVVCKNVMGTQATSPSPHHPLLRSAFKAVVTKPLTARLFN